MSWPFLYVWRKKWNSSGPDNWGQLFIMDRAGRSWELFSYSYELPWRTGGDGKTLNDVSCIRGGEYEMHKETRGNKGWRLELEGTGHRQWVQVHRARPDMYIEGCILPIDTVDFKRVVAQGGRGGNLLLSAVEPGLLLMDPAAVRKMRERWDLCGSVMSHSIALMGKMKERWELLKKGAKGKPTIQIRRYCPGLRGTMPDLTGSSRQSQ